MTRYHDTNSTSLDAGGPLHSDRPLPAPAFLLGIGPPRRPIHETHAMIAVIQRARAAIVSVDSSIRGSISRGFLILLGVHRNDTDADALWIARRIAFLRIFADEAGKMNLSLQDFDWAKSTNPAADGGVLLIPNFTLCAQAAQGNRPSFTEAMPPARAKELWQQVAMHLSMHQIRCDMGVFGADMQVELTNDGPVTILLDSAERPDRE